MKMLGTSNADVKLLEPSIFSDARGFFMESWNAKSLAALGLDVAFVQDNHSRSARHVLRGLHYQLRHPQGKLVRVVAGAAFDVAVDLRRHSPSFGRWIGVELSAENARMLWIPPGFAHGVLAQADGTEILYKCTEFYDADSEAILIWNDPTLAIAWPLPAGARPLLSPKDAAGRTLDQLETFP